MFGVILIGLLVISFAVWGIADIFTGYGSQTVVKVGDIEVDPQEYLRVQREVVQSMSQQAGERLTLQQARGMGLDSRVMDQLIGGAAVDSHAQALHLGISDDALLKEIMKDPGLQDSSGQFSPAMFQQVLRAIGMSEQEFLETQRQRNLRRQLLSTLGEGITVPEVLINALDTYNNQTRTLRYMLVPEDSVPASPEPTETELKTYYDNHVAVFTDPEFRKIGILSVTPQTVKDQVDLSEDELKKTYEAEKAKFDKPEKRHIWQISFPSEEAAQEAYDKIQGGEDFEAIAKAQNLDSTDIDLGVLAHDQMADKVLADKAFALEENKVSEPVKGQLGAIALLRVSNVIAGKESTFEEAKPEIEKALLADRAENAILDLHDKIEDERASGATLAEVAKKLGLKYRVIDQVSRQGNAPDGKPVADIPDKDKLLGDAFASDVGIENDPIDAGDDGFFWYEVAEITPQQVKPFDQVKDDAAKLWRRDDRQARLAAFTDKMVDELKTGKSFQDVAKEIGTDVETTVPLKRTGIALNVLPPAVKQAFALPAKGFGSAEAGVQGARIIFQVDAIHPAEPLPAPAKAQLEQRLKLYVSDDVLAQYFDALQDRYNVSVNTAVIGRLTGSEGQP